jgi:hypothetical protein
MQGIMNFIHEEVFTNSSTHLRIKSKYNRCKTLIVNLHISHYFAQMHKFFNRSRLKGYSQKNCNKVRDIWYSRRWTDKYFKEQWERVSFLLTAFVARSMQAKKRELKDFNNVLKKVAFRIRSGALKKKVGYRV